MIPVRIIVHCSASDDPTQDNLYAIKYLHEMPGTIPIRWGVYRTHCKNFTDIGYHFFIDKAGKIHKGRDEDIKGAHCKGENHDSLAICLSGMNDFKQVQFTSLKLLLKELMKKHSIWAADIFGHNDFNPNKACPSFDLKKIIKEII